MLANSFGSLRQALERKKYFGGGVVRYYVMQAFFNIFEKTQARKNSTAQKTQRFFRPKLNEPVAIVVT